MAYHYTELGLRNVWLENGCTVRQTPYGETIAIEAIDELHQVIGRALTHKAHLTGVELRFLRKQNGLSQAALAHLVGCSEQTVSLWERRGKIPKASDRLIRAVYIEQIDGNVKIQNLLTKLQVIDPSRQERIDLRFSDGDHWRPAPAHGPGRILLSCKSRSLLCCASSPRLIGARLLPRSACCCRRRYA